jgi:steroid delta-isomerase-like uncharacterized protein
MSENTKALVRRAVEEVWNGGDFAAVDALVTRDVLIHASSPGNDIHGPEGIRQFYGGLREAFPDIHFTIEDQVAEGDRVVTRWAARATHKGAFQGIPPTGKQINLVGIDIDRIVNGKVVECWPVADELGLLQQLGALPAPEVSASMPGTT